MRAVISTAIQTKLLTVPELVTAFTVTEGDDAGEFKYYLGIAHGQVILPYIKVNHTYGGERPRTPRREFDTLWQICVVADSQPEAERWDNVIYGTLIPTRLDYLDDWKADQDITYNGAYSDIDTAQGGQRWLVGGYYRIRGSK
jgi:hypothetical protein